MDGMDVIEVDPKLFVTCRLCLEDLGQYQIVPRIQQQIKYCYDIDVLPFDGLPQLICMKCKEILTNFFTVKTSICEKQTNLRSKILKKDITELCNQPQQNTVSSSQLPTENVDAKDNTVKRKKRIIHSSDSETSNYSTKKKKKKTSAKNENSKWDKTNFSKYFVCKICNKECSDMRQYTAHSQWHTTLKTTYPIIFKKSCSVSLKKLDHKPNLTGKNNIVVFDISRIIQNCNKTYYIKYSKDNHTLVENNGLQSVSENCYTKDSESTDSDEEFAPKLKQRKRRALSRSSNETVVIESNNRKSISDNEEDSKAGIQVQDPPPVNSTIYQCINIDDSSDSDQDRSETESRQMTKHRMEAKLGDYKIIQGIITTCISNYHKKNESLENTGRQPNSDYQLKRKLLNMGRKVITKQGFNCTGMLKFLEHKNLGIVWLTKSLSTSNNKESNYIRIMAKLRGTDVMDDNQGWIPVDSPSPEPSNKPDTSLNSIEMTVNAPIADNSNDLQNPMDSAMLFMCSPPDPKNKLLNANPVANPKQLPRKFGQNTELRVTKVVSEPYHMNEESDLCMPIITSTTSLAAPNIIEEHKNAKSPPVAASSADTPAPRIKVKPVSELMSERILKSLRDEQNAAVSTSNFLQKELVTNNILQNHTIYSDNTNNMVINQNNVVLAKNIWVPQSVGNMSNLYVPNMVPQLTVASQPQLTLATQPQFSITSPTQLTLANQPQLTVGNQPQLTVSNQPQLTVSNQLQLVQLQLGNPVDIAPKPTYQIVPATPAPAPSNNTNTKEEFVLLNTVELPNTKTNSPFKYLRKLSRIHNLTLFDPLETLPQEFICLIKFKVQFKQEPIDEPVVLCLSLFCFKHKFCFTVRDRNQKDININKISPNWQWEILNVFRGDLVDKLLQNAQKHSQETHDYTKKFLCLLKSITFKKIS